MIGVNTATYGPLRPRLHTSEARPPLIPTDRLMVGESGIFAPADLAALARVGMSTFLVGESLMRQADIVAATRALLRVVASRVRPGCAVGMARKPSQDSSALTHIDAKAKRGW